MISLGLASWFANGGSVAVGGDDVGVGSEAEGGGWLKGLQARGASCQAEAQLRSCWHLVADTTAWMLLLQYHELCNRFW